MKGYNYYNFEDYNIVIYSKVAYYAYIHLQY